MTNLGDSDYGPATGRRVLVRTIADCLCKENRVVEEWLVRDNLALVLQLGFDPATVAQRQAAADRADGKSLIDTLATYWSGAFSETDAAPQSSASQIAVELLQSYWSKPDAVKARSLSDFRLGAWYPGGSYLYGPDQVADWQDSIREAIPDARLHIDHIAEVPYLGDARDVAVRWSLSGHHYGGGRYGAATGVPLHILAVSHFRIMNGRVREEVTIWDDLAVLRQVASA